ncbi:MAG TPA: tetratricopeptide repeat protein [Ktedonobacterales bacterium]
MYRQSGFRGAQSGAIVPGGQLGQARLALASGQPEVAERICRKKLERQPDDAATRVLLAQVLLQMRRVSEAIAEARRVLKATPNNVDALLVLSSALAQSGGITGGVPDEALKTAERAVQLQPKSVTPKVQLAEIMARKNDYAGARRQLDEAAQIDPRNPSVHMMRAVVLSSDKDYEGAIQSADIAMRYGRQLAPQSVAQAEFIKANALVELGRYDETLTVLNTVDADNPLLTPSTVHSMRGRVYFKQRRIGASYQEFLTAQRTTKLPRFLMPIMAALNMVFTGFFGRNSVYALMVFVVVLAALILFGISFIPVVGQGLSMALVIALMAVLAFTYVRQMRGYIFPPGIAGIASTIFVFIAVLVGGVSLWASIARGPLHQPGNGISAVSFGISGIIASFVAALVAYNWERLTGGRRAA